MISLIAVLNNRARVLWSRCATLPGQYVVFLGKKNLILLSSLHPGVKMGAGELSGKLDDMFGGRGNLAIDWHPI